MKVSENLKHETIPKNNCMKMFYKCISIISTVVTWVTTICVLIAVCTLFVPRFFGTEPYIVLSGSMEPVIHTGSLVYISEIDGKLQEGDIVAYDAGDGIAVVHRIVECKDNGYVTKGDANDIVDMNDVMPSQIIGKYERTVPYAGYILAKLRSHAFYFGPLAMPAVIPIAVGIILVLNVVQYVTGLKIEKRK